MSPAVTSMLTHMHFTGVVSMHGVQNPAPGFYFSPVVASSNNMHTAASLRACWYTDPSMVRRTSRLPVSTDTIYLGYGCGGFGTDQDFPVSATYGKVYVAGPPTTWHGFLTANVYAAGGAVVTLTLTGNITVTGGSVCPSGGCTGDITFSYLTSDDTASVTDVTGYGPGYARGHIRDSQGTIVTNWIFNQAVARDDLGTSCPTVTFNNNSTSLDYQCVNAVFNNTAAG